MKLWFTVSILLLFFISTGCEKTEITDNLEVFDNLAYYDSRIVFLYFSPYYYFDNSGSFLSIKRTITVPNDVHIIDYGYCWVISKGFNDSPKISDNKSSFGPTDFKNFTYTKTFEDAAFFYNNFYYRAYVITDKGIIYDTPTYHHW